MEPDYWEHFYKKYQPPSYESDFAKFTDQSIKRNSTIVDIGCGNGRDSLFFEKNGHTVFSIDNVKTSNFLGKNFIQQNALNLDIKADIYYCRFFIHTLDEPGCDLFLHRISQIIGDSKLFIETRSTTKNKEKIKFISPIGEEHYRMLYSIEYFNSKVLNYFSTEMITKSDTFAVFQNERPEIIRAVLNKK